MSGSPGKRTPRATEIMLIKIGVNKLGIDESTERDMYFALTGQRHASKMDHAQRDKVLRHLQTRGFKVTKRLASHPADDAVSAKIRSLWANMASDGIVRDGSEAGLRSFVRRQTGVQTVEWLSSDQAKSVIVALKSWRGRGIRGVAHS